MWNRYVEALVIIKARIKDLLCLDKPWSSSYSHLDLTMVREVDYLINVNIYFTPGISISLINTFSLIGFNRGLVLNFLPDCLKYHRWILWLSILACKDERWCHIHHIGIPIVSQYKHINRSQFRLLFPICLISLLYTEILLSLSHLYSINDVRVLECLVFNAVVEEKLTVLHHDIERLPVIMARELHMHISKTCISHLLESLFTSIPNLLLWHAILSHAWIYLLWIIAHLCFQ